VSNARANRYRRLALASGDKADTDLLLKLADECDRGILCTSERQLSRLPFKSEQAPKEVEDKPRFAWEPLNDGR
jgi:hypothetical protein